MGRDGGADGDSLGRAEEAGEDTDKGEDAVELKRRTSQEQEQTQSCAGEIRDDQCGFERPAIDEDASKEAEKRDGQQIGDLQRGHFVGGVEELVGEEVDDGEEREEVAEGGDELPDPEPAHDRNAEDLAHGERGGRDCSVGGGRGSGRHTGLRISYVSAAAGASSDQTREVAITLRLLVASGKQEVAMHPGYRKADESATL